jgi:serralysin
MPKPTTSKTIIINGTLGADALFGDTSGTLSNTGGKQTINGLGGDDALYGDAMIMQKRAHGGDDILNGGDGGDNLYGDAFEMHQNSVGGDDKLDGQSGSGVNLYGDAIYLYDNAHGGDDTLTVTVSSSGSGFDPPSEIFMVGDAGAMLNNAQGGNDTLTVNTASVARQHLYGDAGAMYDNARGGNDTLNGGSGHDQLYGDAQSYVPTSAGSITGGTDRLNGGPGNDQLWGGPNDDVFVFGPGSGGDTINDFNRGNLAVGSTATEHDVIDVQAYGFGDWDTLQGKITEVSGNAVIQLSVDDSITLVGVHAADLHETDFII